MNSLLKLMSEIENFEEKYRREGLGEDKKGRVLNALFVNNVPPEKQKSILSKLDITSERKDFLFKTYDIDWLVIKDRKPVLVEEKSVGIQRLRGSSLLVSCGIPTQPQTLQRASEIGIKAGVLVKFTVWGTLGATVEGTIRRHMGYNDGTKVVLSKVYHWGESAFPSGKKIKLVDDFQQLAKRPANHSGTTRQNNQ